MKGNFGRAGLLSALAIGLLGCSAAPPTQSTLDAPPLRQTAEIPRIALSDTIAPQEMVRGEETEQEIQQRRRRGDGRRPSIRWRRTFYGGSYYYVPYYYYYWYPQPTYVPYYSGDYWYYYDRPGFRYRSRRFRRDFRD